MNTSFSFRTLVIGLLLVALIVVGRMAFYFHSNAVKAGEQVKQQENTLAQQSGLISTLQEQDRKNRALAAEQQQREQQLRQQGERYQRALREALKNDKCGNIPMPAAVIDLLQQNAVSPATGSTVTP
ncbi:phage lysis regulatory protein, LysB family [Serratia quinivorans]|nr:phage lysis regulatory protein, LysB family [Serratia quinivorans]